MNYEQVVERARSDREREYVEVQRNGTWATVTLNDPDKLNPLSAALTVQLHDELAALAREPEVRAIVITGRDPAFSVARAWCERIERLPAHVLAMSKPLLRHAADMTWEQAIAMEEFSEPMCFTTEAHQAAVRELLAQSSTDSRPG